MKPLQSGVESVLFDLDGTLVETNIDFSLMKRQMIALAIEQGLDPEPLGSLDILATVESAASFLLSQGKPEEAKLLRAKALNILEEIELLHASSTQEIPLAREFVTELRERRIGVGIVTRNCRKASDMSLRICGITPDVLICREDTVKHKPHPEPFWKALKALSARPGNSWMVGDHIMDIQGGKAAGMRTIGILHASRNEDFFDEVGPDIVARSLAEVRNAIIHRDS